MNNKDQENGALRGPLIFTVPAYGFVMALYIDWLGRSTEQPVRAKKARLDPSWQLGQEFRKPMGA